MKTLNLGQVIYQCRKKNKLTRNQLAELAGVGKTVIYDIEKGKDTIRFNNLKKIFDVLNIKFKLETPFAINWDENK